jgi:hypothetical protein
VSHAIAANQNQSVNCLIGNCRLDSLLCRLIAFSRKINHFVRGGCQYSANAFPSHGTLIASGCWIDNQSHSHKTPLFEVKLLLERKLSENLGFSGNAIQ